MWVISAVVNRHSSQMSACLDNGLNRLQYSSTSILLYFFFETTRNLKVSEFPKQYGLRHCSKYFIISWQRLESPSISLDLHVALFLFRNNSEPESQWVSLAVRPSSFKVKCQPVLTTTSIDSNFSYPSSHSLSLSKQPKPNRQWVTSADFRHPLTKISVILDNDLNRLQLVSTFTSLSFFFETTRDLKVSEFP